MKITKYEKNDRIDSIVFEPNDKHPYTYVYIANQGHLRTLYIFGSKDKSEVARFDYFECDDVEMTFDGEPVYPYKKVCAQADGKNQVDIHAISEEEDLSYINEAPWGSCWSQHSGIIEKKKKIAQINAQTPYKDGFFSFKASHAFVMKINPDQNPSYPLIFHSSNVCIDLSQDKDTPIKDIYCHVYNTTIGRGFDERYDKKIEMIDCNNDLSIPENLIFVKTGEDNPWLNLIHSTDAKCIKKAKKTIAVKGLKQHIKS